LIEKTESNGKTLTNVVALDAQGKTNEIVRLLGGEIEDEYALKHAEELLKQAKEYKNSIN
jgi:DNA repair protein RecN (Recombination protein N)